MPEGPSIVILKEAVSAFKGKKVIKATGNAKIDMAMMDEQKITDFKTWGRTFKFEITHIVSNGFRVKRITV